MATQSAQPSRSTVGARVVEYFTLRGAEEELSKMSEVGRAEVADTIELARQQVAAAEALFAVGHTVEALRLGTSALETTQLAAEQYARALGLSVSPSGAETEAKDVPKGEPADGAAEGASDGDPGGKDGKEDGEPPADRPAPAPEEQEEKAAAPQVPAWKRLAPPAGVSESRVQHAERALTELSKLAVPRLEKDVSPAHVDGFRELVRARATIEDALAPATLTRQSLLGTRIWRGMTAGLLTLVVVFGGYYLMRPVEGTFVRASGTWADSPDFRPEFIIDGNDSTMWLAPLHEGWIEVRMAPPVDVHRVTLVNAGSTAILDRGTREYRLEIYANGVLAQSIDGTFTEELAGTATHEITVRGVDRIRFVARSGYRVGSGLSELRWE